MITWIFTILLVITLGMEGEPRPQFHEKYGTPLRYTTIPYEQQRQVRQDPQQFLDRSTLAKMFEGNFNFYENLNQLKPQKLDNDVHARYGVTEDSDGSYGGGNYRKSHSINLLGPGHIETIESEHYQRKVPAFDVSDFHHHAPHHAEESHAEVHYHEHKHMHKHDHKQEHAHMHKNQHQHKHSHQQHHKHDHHSEHKHGHEHKHDHHQKHKHDHHHKHKHGHDQKHKHDHHHGHKHQHHVNSHHGHEHGHKGYDYKY